MANSTRAKTKAPQILASDAKILRSLASASADDAEAWPRIASAFERHLRDNFSDSTARKYQNGFTHLYKHHRKTFAAMASDEFLGVVRRMKLRFNVPAAVTAFREFWSKSDRSLNKSIGSTKRPISDLGAVSKPGDKRSKAVSKPVDQRSKEDDLSDAFGPFVKDMSSRLVGVTAKQYGQTLRRLALRHKGSPDSMATEEYMQKVRRMDLPFNYSAAVRAFCKWRGREATESTHESREHANKEGAPTRDDIKDAFQPFVDEMSRKLVGITAKQYGQSLRKLARLHKKSPDMMATEAYMLKVRGMDLPFKYSAAVRAFCKWKGLEIACHTSEKREHANNEARDRLAASREHSRPVSDADVLAVFRLWPFSANKSRLNVMPKGVKQVDSTTVGLIGDRTGRTLVSSATHGSEDVVRLLCQWLEHQLGVQLGADAFPVTCININKGYAAARHRDRNNAGPSALRALGDCRGGMLRYWPGTPPDADLESLRDADARLLDPKHGLVMFDGNFPHAVTPFEGERYSVVFFTSGKYKMASARCRAECKRLGMRWPTAQLLSDAAARVTSA